ncbi:MAG: COX15/CtaA family protein [Ginsengibacter sp.]
MVNNLLVNTSSKNVSRWLFAGVIMLMIQILLGGITRLTESGLSITEWNPITGALPPLDNTQWLEEFEKYKHTDQFRYIHADFSLSDFKFIFFWEWMHRSWARLMGIVFLVGFIYFLVKKQLRQDMIIPFIILFLLGLMQGAIGWIMVKSGLVPEKLFVGHIQLATHFVAALLLLCYTWWFSLSLAVAKKRQNLATKLKTLTWIILSCLFLQLVYGAFMAGLHAATAAPTWPSINGKFIPDESTSLSPAWKNFIDNKIMVQFIHRALAYVILFLTVVWSFASFKNSVNPLLRRTRLLPGALIVLQVILGIATVLTSPYGNNLVWFGVAHQLVAILFLMVMVFMLYILRSEKLPRTRHQ